MMKRVLFVAFSTLVLISGLILSGVSITNAQDRRLVTRKVDENDRVALKGSTRPDANAENDRGALADARPLEHVWLLMRREPATEQALVKYLDGLTDRHSANYHKWLTAAQFREKFGPAKEDVSALSAWLGSHGITVNHVYANGVVDISATAGKFREAFNTEIHNLNVDGVPRIANMSDPDIPASLAPAVKGFVSLSNWLPHSLSHPRSRFAGANGFESLVPGDLATIYSLNQAFAAGITGKGQTIAVIEDTDLYSDADWGVFRKEFGLGTYRNGTLSILHPQLTGSDPLGGGGTCVDPGVNGDDAEAIIDVSWASAAAPNAAIWMLSCADTFNFGGFIAMENMLENGSPIPNIISISYGESEVENGEGGIGGNDYIQALYQLAAAEGVSVFVSSGDEGAASSDANRRDATHGITVSALTSTAYNVSVGGTDFGDFYACLIAGTCVNTANGGTHNPTYWNATNTATYASARSYVPEVPWNDSCASVLIATLLGHAVTYGSTGSCNTSPGNSSFLTTASGSGGPSNCFTGTPTIGGVASGTCAGNPKPAWQSVFGNPADGVRDIPDVALFAANGVFGHYYVVCYTDPSGGGTPCIGQDPSTWAGFGGTSVSSPIMAGIQALVNQHTGMSFQGNTAPILYQLARAEYGASGNAACNSTLGNGVASSCVFYDVTQGDMDLPCRKLSGVDHNCYMPSGTNGVLSLSNTSYQPAYSTTPGWDFPTGIGSVNAYNLIMNWP